MDACNVPPLNPTSITKRLLQALEISGCILMAHALATSEPWLTLR